MQKPQRKLKGNESLFLENEKGALLSATVLDFWQWAFSDLSMNNIRGVFSEWLVAKLLYDYLLSSAISQVML